MRSLPICSKRAYESKGQAKAAHRLCSWRFRVYRCPNCGKHHVTNAEKRGRSWEEIQ